MNLFNSIKKEIVPHFTYLLLSISPLILWRSVLYMSASSFRISYIIITLIRIDNDFIISNLNF